MLRRSRTARARARTRTRTRASSERHLGLGQVIRLARANLQEPPFQGVPEAPREDKSNTIRHTSKAQDNAS